jgi:hypothetical protein
MKLCYVRGAAVLFTLTAASPVSAASSPVAARLLQAHNAERWAVGAAPLMWDWGLAAAADRYASELARTGRWGHSPQYRRAGQGENLWMGTRGAFRLDGMMADWTSEKRMFRSGRFPHVSRSGSWSDVGHYTQIIWPRTTRVGCALRSSRDWDYLVCRYSSPGNMMGERVGAPRYASRY